MRRRGMIFLALLACGVVARADEPTSFNEKIVEFARSNLGRRAGDGGCSALAAEALRYAGATARGPGRGWGGELPTIPEARPGDILHFQDPVFVQRRLAGHGSLVTLQSNIPH